MRGGGAAILGGGAAGAGCGAGGGAGGPGLFGPCANAALAASATETRIPHPVPSQDLTQNRALSFSSPGVPMPSEARLVLPLFPVGGREFSARLCFS